MPMTEAELNALVRPKIQAVFEGAVLQSVMFDLLEVVTPDALPGGSIADEAGVAFQHVYEANLSATGFSPGGALPAAGAERKVPCRLGYGKYTAAFDLTHFQYLQLLNGGADGMIVDDELGRQKRGMVRAIIDRIETDIMSGAGADRIQGLTQLITDVGNVYGQAIAIYPTLGAYRNTAGAPRALDMTILDDVHNTMRNTFKALRGPRLFGWTSTAQRNAVKGLPGVNTPTSMIVDGGTPTHQVATGRVFYDRTEFIDVPGATANTIYITDSDVHKLVAKPSPEDGSIFHVMPAERRGDVYRFEVYVYIQQVILEKAAIIDQLS